MIVLTLSSLYKCIYKYKQKVVLIYTAMQMMDMFLMLWLSAQLLINCKVLDCIHSYYITLLTFVCTNYST